MKRILSIIISGAMLISVLGGGAAFAVEPGDYPAAVTSLTEAEKVYKKLLEVKGEAFVDIGKVVGGLSGAILAMSMNASLLPLLLITLGGAHIGERLATAIFVFSTLKEFEPEMQSIIQKRKN